MTFQNRELLSAMKDCGRSVLRVNGVEFVAVTDGKEGMDSESAMI